MAALSWVELTKVVVKGFPDQFTTALSATPLPLTVIRKYGPPASIRLGEALVMVGAGASAARPIAQRTRHKQRKCGLIRLKECSGLTSPEISQIMKYAGDAIIKASWASERGSHLAKT